MNEIDFGIEFDTQVDVPGWDAVAEAGRVAPPSAAVLAAAGAALDAAVRVEASAQAGDSGGTVNVTDLDAVRSRRRGRRLVLTAAAAAVVTVCAVASALVGPGAKPTAQTGQSGQPFGQHAGVGTASGFLDGVATVAYARPAPTAPYWKTRVAAFNAGGAPVLAYTEWLSRTGATVAVDGAKYTKSYPRGLSWLVGEKNVDWNALDRLPTDPKALAARFATGNGSGLAFTEIGDLLGESPARPALRAALYRVLAGLDGVHLVGGVTDSTGRHGTAVEFSTPTTTERLLVDPATGLLLEQSSFARVASPADPNCLVQPGNPGHCRPALRVGELIKRTTYLEAAPAASVN